MQQHCIEAVIINGYDLRVMRMGYFAFLVHPLVRAASGAGIAFSSGNEWDIYSFVSTSVTVLDSQSVNLNIFNNSFVAASSFYSMSVHSSNMLTSFSTSELDSTIV